jgi:hypothetical protein
MKKSTLIATIAFAFTLLLSANANAQKFPDLDKSPMDVASTLRITKMRTNPK